MGYSLVRELTPRTQADPSKKIISEYIVDAVADLSDIIDFCAPGSVAYTPDLATICTMAPTGQWQLPATVPLLITAQPEDIATTAGAIAGSLSVSAYTNPDCSLTYAWQRNDEENYASPTPIAGATSATYAIPEGTTAGTYYYFCILTANGVSINSSIATVVVAAGE